MEDLTPEIQNRALTLAAQADRVPDINNDETLSKATDLLKYLSEARKSVEEDRKHMKAPILEAAKRLDQRAKAVTDNLDAAIDAVKQKVGLYMDGTHQTFRGERGGHVGLRHLFDFEVTDFAALGDEYKTVDTKTIRAAIKAGARAIPGVSIVAKRSVTVR